MALRWSDSGNLSDYEGWGQQPEPDPALARLFDLAPAVRRVVLVRDIMTSAVVTIGRQATLARAHQTMVRGGFRHLPVQSASGRLEGILSDRDLLAHLGELGVEHPTTVGEVMSRKLLTATPRTEIRKAASMLVHHRVSCLPVIQDDRHLVGIVTTTDLLRSIARHGPVEVWL